MFYCMGVKLGLSHEVKNKDQGCLSVEENILTKSKK